MGKVTELAISIWEKTLEKEIGLELFEVNVNKNKDLKVFPFELEEFYRCLDTQEQFLKFVNKPKLERFIGGVEKQNHYYLRLKDSMDRLRTCDTSFLTLQDLITTLQYLNTFVGIVEASWNG